jgi:glycerol-3-phosphate dehydrogenase (NAD+)
MTSFPMKRVGIIGSGNWGTTIARVIAENVVSQPDFDNTVQMWVFDEVFEGESLVKIINTRHENAKYLPGFPLPPSILAVSDLVAVTESSDYLVFVVPHQFLKHALDTMFGHVRPGAVGISLIKGLTFLDDRIELVTDTIERVLGIKCGGLMGANIANDIAARDFCESTLVAPIPGSEESEDPWIRILDCAYFHVETLSDIAGQQLFGTLKNVIAIAGGIVDGLGYGQSSKAAVLRQGLVETYRFGKWVFPERDVQIETMLASCGFGDIVASAYGGRNRLCAEAFAKTGKTFPELEAELLKGQHLAGTVAAQEIFQLLRSKKATREFPFFTTINLIIQQKVPPKRIFQVVGEHLDLAA